MALAALSLLAGLVSGLVRLGWFIPLPTVSLPDHHGPLMVVGFLGTLIGLERAVALGWRWTYCAPFFAVSSALVFMTDLPIAAGQLLAALSSLCLVSISLVLYCRHPVGFLATIGLGAVLWFAGNLLWTGGYPLHRVVGWWIGFPLITIAGERLELSRLRRPSLWSKAGFLLANVIFVLGLVVSVVDFLPGVRLAAVGVVAVTLWLLCYDIAWRTVRHKGLPRYMAICLLTGYLWLGLGGVLWFVFADLFIAGLHYDAILHAFFLGFVFSMIFGHAPIVFPSVVGVPLPFRHAFYVHLVLLHLSVLLRVTGDLTGRVAGAKWGGLLSVLTILVFLVNNVRSIILARFENP